MGFFNICLGKLQIPLYDIAALGAAMFVGYNHGKGIPTGSNVEFLALAGPTAFSIVYTPTAIKALYSFGGWANRRVQESIASGNLEVKLANGTTKRYRELSDEERQAISPKIEETGKTIESRLANPRYLKPTLIAGAKTGAETVAGYLAGRLLSMIA